jgi:hypothetical protein
MPKAHRLMPAGNADHNVLQMNKKCAIGVASADFLR